MSERVDRYAVVDRDGYVIETWTAPAARAGDAKHIDTANARCSDGNTWVWVDGDCAVGDRLVVDEDHVHGYRAPNRAHSAHWI